MISACWLRLRLFIINGSILASIQQSRDNNVLIRSGEARLVLCSHSILGLGIGYSGINALQFASGVVESHLPIDGALFDADVICPCGCFVL